MEQDDIYSPAFVEMLNAKIALLSEKEKDEARNLSDMIIKHFFNNSYFNTPAQNTQQEYDLISSIMDYIKSATDKLQDADLSPMDTALNYLILRKLTDLLDEKLSLTSGQPNEKPSTETLKSKLPEKYCITNNKLSNEMTQDFLNNGEFMIAVIKPNKKGEVCTYNSLSYEGSEISIAGRQQFTAYDRTVHNAVCTLYVAGNELMTPQMIYRTFNGMTDGEYISPQAVGAVTKSIDKSRFTRLKVDFTAEAKARHLNVDTAIIDSNLLYAEAVIITAGGIKTTAYKIIKMPALYKYAQLTKQIISVPLPLLDTREATRNTEEIIPIKEYLIRRIEIMKHNDTSNKIVYDTIFNETGVNLTSQSQRNRMRTYITSILTLWQKRDKYIKGFAEYKEGKSFKGIEITY